MKTGNVKQVAAFEKLLGTCNALGASYNPSKASLMPTALTTLLEQAQQTVEAVKVARTNYLLAINARNESFAGIPKLATRVVRGVKAFESSEENIKDAFRIKRRLMSKQKSRAPIPSGQVAGGTPLKEAVSSSRLDYDGKMETFGNLIQLVQGIASYNPNETDLKVESLKAVLADLQTRSTEVMTASAAYSKARIARNQALYGNGGVHQTATAVKDYIRFVYGGRSEQSGQISKIRFES